MQDTRSYSVYPSDLDMRLAFQALLDDLGRMGFSEAFDSDCPSIYMVNLHGERRLRTSQFSEFLDILGQFKQQESIYILSHWNSKSARVGLDMQVRASRIEVAVDGDLVVISGLDDRVREVFRAFNPEPPKAALLDRVNVKKSVFLAHRFDQQGSDASRALTGFLTALGFHVVDGDSYEARDIPDKVSERIRGQDIFILVATPGDLTWLVGEGAYAKALNKYVVVLVQDGADLKKAIIGSDFEHIEFPKGDVEKAFISLLHALPT